MRHEVLFLNSRRTYVRVGETWYDNHIDNGLKVGDKFLLGPVEEVLTFEQYKDRYPESKTEIYYEVADKTHSGGFLRKVSDKKIAHGEYQKQVEYAVNPAQPAAILKQDIRMN